MRGSFAEVILPNDEEERLVLGPLKFTLLKRLKNSARNCALARSVTFVFLIRPRSVSKKPGARRMFLPELPNVPLALATNRVVSKYLAMSWPWERLGSRPGVPPM